MQRKTIAAALLIMTILMASVRFRWRRWQNERFYRDGIFWFVRRRWLLLPANRQGRSSAPFGYGASRG
jgi:hypothetical protein